MGKTTNRGGMMDIIKKAELWDYYKELLESQIQQSNTLAAENERLREKLAAMESQIPGGKVIKWIDSNTAICSGEGFSAADIDAEIYFKHVPADKPAVAVPDDVYEALANELWELGLDTKPGYAPQLGEVYEILDKHLAIAPSHSQQSGEHEWDGKGRCRKCSATIFGRRDRCPSHESEQQ